MVYAQAVKRRDRLAKPQLEAFDRALQWQWAQKTL